MSKKFVVGAAVLSLLGAAAIVGSPSLLDSSEAFAQAAPEQQSRPLFSREDAGAYLEARIAALHAGLQLSPEQERLWPPFEQAYRERGKQRLAAVAAGAPPNEDPIARLQRRADALLQQGAVLKRLAEAAAPLWQSLDDGQKRRFTVLTRPFNQRFAFGMGFGRPDGSQGAPGRDGRFGLEGPRGFGFGPGGPNFRMGPGGPFGPGDRDGDREGRGMGPGMGPPGMGPGIGPRMRFGEDFRGPRGGEDFRGPRGGDGGFGGDPRDGRDAGRDFGRGLFRWWRGGPDGGPGRGGGRELRGDEERL